MSNKKTHKKVEIDRRRLERIRANLLEQMEAIARISKATLELDAGAARRIHLTATTQGTAGGGDPQVAVQVTCNVDFEDGSTACYEDPPGVCCPGPCPC